MYLLIFLFIISIAFPGYATTVEDKAAVLNRAGKQRMLTQRISQKLLHISHEVEMLKKLMAEFEQVHHGLLHGDAKLNLVKTENPEIITQLNQVGTLWQSFRDNVEAMLLKENIFSQNLKQIIDQNMPLMENMDRVVKHYEQEFFASLEPGMATTINLAGKQRMLTQKMGKEILLILKGINPAKNRTILQETRQLFDKTLQGLLDGNSELGLPGTQKNTSIYNKLLVVKKLWQAYQPILEKIVQGRYQKEQQELLLVDATRINTHLLKHMHDAVNLYEKSVKLEFSSLRSN